ncbi:fucose permease [Photobacterium aphoticum]|uniref:Fucose permease n=1 Tax=Photobacterium aphoticum TaxID=754436 RepID=A0A090QIS9_9GAMM|nr:fucose permease [Photobacterium aphoticum]
MIICVWIAIALTKMPKASDAVDAAQGSLKDAFGRLMQKKHFVRGVIGQFFYVGAQIGCWSWTIRYVMTQVGGTEADASTYLLVSIITFSAFRFICVGLMKFIAPEKLLSALASLATIFTLILIVIGGTAGAYALVGISACMSLMFPTIFGLSLRDLGQDAKFGGSCLIMAILGGAVLTASWVTSLTVTVSRQPSSSHW